MLSKLKPLSWLCIDFVCRKLGLKELTWEQSVTTWAKKHESAVKECSRLNKLSSQQNLNTAKMKTALKTSKAKQNSQAWLENYVLLNLLFWTPYVSTTGQNELKTNSETLFFERNQGEKISAKEKAPFQTSKIIAERKKRGKNRLARGD